MSICLARALVLLAACLAANTAPAQDAVEAFYRGKAVTIVVGSAVGGGFDAYARLMGRHLARFIPGNPTIVVQNIPGAGSNKAASYVALQAPKDGTVIGAVQAIAVTQPLVSDQPLPHDPSKLVMLGSANRSVFFCVVRSDAPVKSFQDTFEREAIIGTSSEGATQRGRPRACTSAFATEAPTLSPVKLPGPSLSTMPLRSSSDAPPRRRRLWIRGSRAAA